MYYCESDSLVNFVMIEFESISRPEENTLQGFPDVTVRPMFAKDVSGVILAG